MKKFLKSDRGLKFKNGEQGFSSIWKKFKRSLKKGYRKIKYLDKTQANLYGILIFVSIFCIFTGSTYAFFNFSVHKNASTITIAKLEYDIDCESVHYNEGEVRVASMSDVELSFNIKSLNDIETRYALNYSTNNSNIIVYYQGQRVQNVEGIIAPSGVLNAKIIIRNLSDTEATVDLIFEGGYTQNTLASNIDQEFLDFHMQDAVTSVLAKEIPNGVRMTSQNFDGVALTPEVANTGTFSVKGKNMYFTYGTSFTYDSSTDKYKLEDPQVCYYDDCYETLVGKYVTSIRGASTDDVVTESFLIYIIESTTDTGISSYKNGYETYKSGSYNVSNPSSYYVAYSDSFKASVTINEPGKITLDSPQICLYAECYQKLEGKYIMPVNSSTDMASTNNRNEVYMIESVSSSNYEYKRYYYPTDRNVHDNSLKVIYDNNYIYDPATKLFTLSSNNTKCTYEECYQDLVGKYMISFDTASNLGSQTLYRVTSATPSQINYEKLLPTKVENATFDPKINGVYPYKDSYGTSYYYRGSVTDNYVKFANMYWRIIRINGNGSLRIIYDGTEPHANGTELSLPINSLYNTAKTDDNMLVGYMYGKSGTKESSQKNTNSSSAKTALENWYKTNLESYKDYIADSIFCNDRSIPGPEATGYNNDTGSGKLKEVTGYGALARFVNTNGWISRIDVKPILTCPQKNDAFTVSDTVKGNGALTYPIGLITADEAILAGGGWKFANSEYYLYTGVTEWTMTPFRFSGINARLMQILDTGEMGDLSSDGKVGIRPVINIKAEYARNMIGDGTIGNEYRLAS